MGPGFGSVFFLFIFSASIAARFLVTLLFKKIMFMSRLGASSFPQRPLFLIFSLIFFVPKKVFHFFHVFIFGFLMFM